MNGTTGDPGQPGGAPWPRPACLPYLLVNTVMRFLAADGCEKISVTTLNSSRAVRAASGLLRALGITPDRKEP